MTFASLVDDVRRRLDDETRQFSDEDVYRALNTSVERIVLSQYYRDMIARETAAILAEHLGDVARATALRLG